MIRYACDICGDPTARPVRLMPGLVVEFKREIPGQGEWKNADICPKCLRQVFGEIKRIDFDAEGKEHA